MKRIRIISFLFVFALPLLAGGSKQVEISAESRAEIDQLTKRADSLMLRKQYEDAILTYQKVLVLDPRDPVAHNKMGIAYHQLMNLQMAKVEYEQAKKLNPKYYEAWNNLGAVYYGLKNYNKAVKYYRKAITLNSTSANTYHNLGAAYFAVNKNDEGYQSFQEAFRLDPAILEKLSSSGTIIRTADVNQGAQDFYIAKLYVQSGQTEKALSYLLKAIENGFNDYDKITKDPDFKALAQDERLTRMLPSKQSPN
jgi:tetratricopeptide (TPR) repeat protein